MAGRMTRSAHRDLDTLFQIGVVGGLSDGQLLERFAARREGAGEAAFEEVVRRHGPMVLGVCRRLLGDRPEADDAFQATFLVLALKADSVRKRESLGPWLHGVAARVARRARQVERGRKEVPLAPEDPPASDATEPAAAELRLILDEELGRLPEKYRRPVVLCYLEGQTQEEAAQSLGWTKGTVSGRLARAKDLLRERLTRRGLAPTASVLAACLVPETASAAVPAALVRPTIRAASAAGLAGMGSALGSGRVMELARGAIRAMSLGRLKSTVPALLLALGAAAVAAPRLLEPAPAGRAPRVSAIARDEGRAVMVTSGERMRLGTTDRRHTASVCDVAYASDGRAVVTAQVDGIIRIWDPSDGGLVRTFDIFGGVASRDKALRAVAFSPDGTLLAGVGFVFDPGSRRMIHGIWRWNLEDDLPLRTFEVDTLDLFCLAFSPEGASLATGDYEGKVQLWDVVTGAELASLDLGRDRVTAIAFSPDGMTLAASVLNLGVRLWDLGGGKDLGMLSGKPVDRVSCPRFSSDGRSLAAVTADGAALIWDRADLSLRRRIESEGEGILSLTFAPDGRSLAVVGVQDGDLRLIDAETGRRRWAKTIARGAHGGSVAFAQDGRTVVTTRGGVLRFFDSDTGTEQYATAEAHQGPVSSLRYSRDGRMLFSAGDDGTVRQWDLRSGRQVRSFEPDGGVGPIAIAPDGLYIAAATGPREPAIRLWDLAYGEPSGRYTVADREGALALSFATDGKTLLQLGHDGMLRTLDAATGRELSAVAARPGFPKEDDGGPPTRGLFSTRTEHLAVCSQSKAYILDPVTGMARFSCPSDAIAFSHDGRTVASATPGEAMEIELADRSKRIDEWRTEGIDLLDAISGRRRLRISRSRDRVVAMAYSPDDTLIAVADRWPAPLIRLYRTDDGREIQSISPPAAVARAEGLAFSPDGRGLAAGLEDTTVLIWDVNEAR